MLSRRLLRLAQTPRPVAPLTSVRFYNPDQKGDPLDQAHRAGHAASDPRNASPVDAASPDKGKKAPHDLRGNREGLGFAEQVGSASTSAHHDQHRAAAAEGHTGAERVTPPSLKDAVKKALGMETSAGEDKQNRGGGVGVTGTGQLPGGRRSFHSAPVRRADPTRGQAPEASRQRKDSTHGEQNEHLKHKPSAATPDSGKGNAAEEPTLPSQHFQTDASWTKGASGPQQKRAFSTSARASTKHTADSYFKDVDSAEPVNPKVHQVDASTGGAPVARANEQPATGEFSRSGPDHPEYETTSKHDQPYDIPPTRGPEKDEKLRYGAEPGVRTEKPSQPDEGPAGKDAGGRKPESGSA